MKLIHLLLFLLISGTLFSQNQIQFTNPSFEDTPQPGKAPRSWYDCGHEGETPPDIQPNGQFKITKEPQDGRSYLGLVVRDNETWEAVGQRLKTPLLANSTYAFGIHVARSQYYVSMSRTTGEKVNYTTGACLRIWGGNEYCEKKELLYTSERITNSRWVLINIELTPKEEYNYIIFEAYYVTPTKFAYNGNILLDNIVTNAPSLNTEVNTETTKGVSELQKDLWAMEEMLEFFKYAKQEQVFNYFDFYDIKDIEELAQNFEKFELHKSASTIEKLIVEWKGAFVGINSTEEKISAFEKSCKKIDKILIADQFDEKIDAFIEKNREELKLLIKE